MKKNKMLRAASALLVMTFLTTGIIGGTFAKYVTVGSATDTARVAKWGVTITTSGSLYSDAYYDAKSTTGNQPAVWETAGNTVANSISVAAETKDDNIVAPGTKSFGKGLSFSISGTPEVAVEIKTSITAEDIYLAEGTYGVLAPVEISGADHLEEMLETYKEDGVYFKENNAYTKVPENSIYDGKVEYYVLTNKVTLDKAYFPVAYKLEETPAAPGGVAPQKAIEVAKELARAVKGDDSAGTVEESDYKVVYEDISKNFDANTDLGNGGPKLGNKKLSWEWPYTSGDSDEAKEATDKKDTILGNLIAARGGSSSYVVVSVGNNDAVTELTIGTGDEYTVKNADKVVANLRTKFDITLEATQVD